MNSDVTFKLGGALQYTVSSLNVNDTLWARYILIKLTKKHKTNDLSEWI